MAEKNKAQVLIAGKIYTLSGYESEEYLQRVATYINNKLTEFKKVDGYSVMAPEMKSILLELNIADDYFKAKRQVELTEDHLAEKEKELYELKHELISAQIRLETTEKALKDLQEEASGYEKRIIQLETQLKTSSRR